MHHRDVIYEYRLNIINNMVVIVIIICIIYGTRIAWFPHGSEVFNNTTDVIHPNSPRYTDMEE